MDSRVVDGGRRGRCVVDKRGAGRYGWRLTSANGRVVGLSPAVYGGVDEANRAFEALRAGVSTLSPQIVHEKDSAGWVWLLPGPRGVPQARSMRAYDRFETCRSAFRTFLALLGIPASEPVAP